MNKLLILRESMIFIKYYAIVTPILALVVVIELNPSFQDTFCFDFLFFFLTGIALYTFRKLFLLYSLNMPFILIGCIHDER